MMYKEIATEINSNPPQTPIDEYPCDVVIYRNAARLAVIDVIPAGRAVAMAATGLAGFYDHSAFVIAEMDGEYYAFEFDSAVGRLIPAVHPHVHPSLGRVCMGNARSYRDVIHTINLDSVYFTPILIAY